MHEGIVPGCSFWVHLSFGGEELCQEASTDPALSSDLLLYLKYGLSMI